MAKLSNREKAAKKSGGTLDYKTGKITVAPKVMAKPKLAPLMGAGPLMPGQTRQANSYGGGSQLQGAGPLLPGQTRAKDSYSGAENRNKAVKAQESKIIPGMGVSGLTGNDFGRTGTPIGSPKASGTTLSQGSSSLLDTLKNKVRGASADVFGSLGQMYGNNGLLRAEGDRQLGSNIENGSKFAFDNTLGIPGANASNQQDMPTGYGDDGTIFYNGRTDPTTLRSDFATPGTDFSRPGSELAYNQGQDPRFMDGTMLADNGVSRNQSNPFGIPTAYAAETDTPYNDYGGNSRYREDGQSMDNIQNPMATETGIDPTLQEEMRMQQNETYGGGKPADVSSGTTRRPYGSGQFGTGKGVQSDDPYIKELRKAYSSNGGEKWLRKQFEELIASLDPTYAALQKEGTDALQAQLLNNNNQLASVMNANNTGDSEQRAQLMAGQQRDTQTSLGNLLAKLSQAKAGDVSQYKQQYAQQRGNLAEKNQSNQQKLLDLIRQYQGTQQKTTSQGYDMPNIAESDVLKTQRALGISRTQALKLLREEAQA